MSTVIIEQTGGNSVTVENRRDVQVSVHNEHRIVVVSGSATTGGGDAARPAAEPISALRLVSDHEDGVRPLDPTSSASVAAMLGVTVTAAGNAGEPVRLRTRVGDTIDDAGWSWVPGFVFAGPNGTLTQTVPTVGWEIVVGYAPWATRLNLTFDEPVKLA